MCDTMVRITNGQVLFAKNSDRDPNESQILEWHPAAEHPQGSRVTATWITIPQVARTRAVVISRPWWIWGAEMGTNDAGVTIGNEAVFTKASLRGEPGLIGMDLLRLALERAGDAESAVEVIVSLLEKYGQAGAHSHENPRFAYHNSFLIADPRGAVVLETAGRTWAAEEVRGPARSISNGLTIPGFAEKYSDRLRSRVSQCAVRQPLTQQRTTQAKGVADLFDVLRDNGTGGGPAWSLMNGSMMGPNMHAGGLLTSSLTASSWVGDLSTGQHWATGTADPALSLFLPVRVNRPAHLGPAPNNVYDAESWWWSHERFRRKAARDWEHSLTRVSAERDEIEAVWLADPPRTEVAAAEARAAYSRWEREVTTSDTRPALVRHLWRRWDRAAELTT